MLEYYIKLSSILYSFNGIIIMLKYGTSSDLFYTICKRASCCRLISIVVALSKIC